MMQRGRVKWFSVEKGYGFIEPLEGGQDVFVHRDNISDLDSNEGLREGDVVEFNVERTPKGLSAQNVQRAETGLL